MTNTLQTALGFAGALGLVAALATPVEAAPLSGNAAVTTNYVFRGVSQSAGNPAAQAGLDYDLGSVVPGLAVGTWASSIDFGDDSPLELDLYGSYTGMINDQFSWSVGAITYNYPNAPHGVNYNWYEVWAGLTYNFGVASLTGKIFYSPDYVNLSNREIYYNGAVSIPLASWLSLNGSVGYTDLENDVFPLIKSYTDWGVNLAATYDNYTLTVGYTGTDLSGGYKITSGPFETDDQFWVMLSFKLP